jgi:hypothetical protein
MASPRPNFPLPFIKEFAMCSTFQFRFRWGWLALCCVIFAILGETALAQTYEQKGSVLYEKVAVTVPYVYYQYGYKYTGYRTEYQLKEVLNYQKPGWREQALALIDKQKERESYESTLELLGVQGLMTPKYAQPATGFGMQQFQQVPYEYPSASGKTVGAFTYYEQSKYGYPAPFDVNKADERAHASADAVVRMTADIGAIAGNAAQQAIGVQRLNMERVGAIAEMQEMRAIIKERAAAERDRNLAEREKLLAEAEVFRAMKPPPSSSQRHYQGQYQDQQIQEAPVEQPQAQYQGGVHPGFALVDKYCGDCHGGGMKNPAGGFKLDPGISLSQSDFQALKLRMDPNSPEHRVDTAGIPMKDSQGRPVPFRMPPAEYPFPNGEELDLIVQFAESLVTAKRR